MQHQVLCWIHAVNAGLGRHRREFPHLDREDLARAMARKQSPKDAMAVTTVEPLIC
jgi:hypothetical protein